VGAGSHPLSGQNPIGRRSARGRPRGPLRPGRESGGNGDRARPAWHSGRGGRAACADQWVAMLRGGR